MNLQIARSAAGVVCVCAALLVGACGKRGNPMPPLARIPAPPTDLVVTRLDDEVYLRVTVPLTNVDGLGPADVARVDVYAVTLDRDPRPLGELDPEDVRKRSTLVASERVRRPVAPPPPPKEGEAPPPAPPEEPGVDQGATVVVREALTESARAPVSLPTTDEPARSAPDERTHVSRPLVAPAADAGPQRYYYAVAVSARGRHSPHTGVLAVPLGPTSSAPSQPQIEVTETSATIRWTPPVDARGSMAPTKTGLLPSRSLVPAPPATTYEIFEIAGDAESKPAVMPAPLTEPPVSGTAWTQQNTSLGTERCFAVRAVDTLDGKPVRGPASPVGCASFADVFAPGPPHDLIAASVPAAITLIWEASDAKDVAGYLVLRGEAGSDTLTPLNTAPTSELRYRDESVTSGVRYVYAVVAVDQAGNTSKESGRVEETAR